MAIFPIDDSRPLLSVGGLPVQWHTGSAALLSLSSRLTRISAHGVMFKPRAWRLRADMGALAGAGGLWASQRCVPSAFGLCGGGPNGSVVFPSAETPLIDQSLDWVCGAAASNTQRAIVSGPRYDTSACDVLDARGDYVLSGDVLFWTRESALPAWLYWTVCALVVFLVRCLSKYVLASLQSATAARGDERTERPNPLVSVAACFVAVALVLSQGDFVYVTEEDLLFHRVTVLYVCSYAGLFLCTRLAVRVRGWQGDAARDPPFYNLLAGVILLVAERLYCSAETPYNPALLFIVACRALVKSRRGHDALRSATLLLDALLLGLGCTLGFSPRAHYLIALFAAALAASDVLVCEA